jgi:hypothetical protein
MNYKAELRRLSLNSSCTLGKFNFSEADGKTLFTCFTCENPIPEPRSQKTWAKVKSQTPIPYGVYKCKWTYSPKYQRNMWELQNVPGFAGIRIHVGNTSKDTEGCILFGEFINNDCTGILQSRAAVAEFEKLTAELGNPDFELEILVVGVEEET